VNNDGTIFRLDPPADGDSAWTFTLLHSFTDAAGSDTERIVDGACQALRGSSHHRADRKHFGLTGTRSVFYFCP